MTKYHVLAAVGDLADELRSLGLHEAPTASAALARCLAELDQDPVADQEAVRDLELAELLRRAHQQLRDALVEPDVSFIVTPVAAEAHFMRDHDGIVKPAGEVARRRARMWREFGGCQESFAEYTSDIPLPLVVDALIRLVTVQRPIFRACTLSPGHPAAAPAQAGHVPLQPVSLR